MKFLKRTIIYSISILIALQIVYLVGANIFLNSAYFKNRLNRRAPAFEITWQSAYTLFPTRIRVREAHLSFDRHRIRWSLSCEEGRLIISPLQLLDRIFHCQSLALKGVESSYSFYKDEDALQPMPREGHRPWVLEFDSIGLDEPLNSTVQGFAVEGPCKVDAAFRLVTRNTFELRRLDLKLDGVQIAKNGEALLHELTGQLTATTSPFIPAENRGKLWLNHLESTVELVGNIHDRSVPSSILSKLPWLTIDDAGSFQGSLIYNEGLFKPGSKIGLWGTKIQARYHDLTVQGLGQLDMVLREASMSDLQFQNVDLEIGFNEFQVDRPDLQQPLAIGDHLKLVVESRDFSLDSPFSEVDVRVELPRTEIPTIQGLNAYLGKNHFLRLERGQAHISGQIQYLGDAKEAGGWLYLESDSFQVKTENQSATAGLDLKLHFRSFRPGNPVIDFTGSTLTLTNESKTWNSQTIVTDGFLKWPESILKKGSQRALKTAKGRLNAFGQLSDMAFLNPLLKDFQGFKLNGTAQYRGSFYLANGELAEPSRFSFEIPQGQAHVLGYSAKGRTILDGNIQKKARKQHAELNLIIRDYQVWQGDTQTIHSKGDRLEVHIEVPDFSLSHKTHHLNLDLDLPADQIPDMSTYNSLWGDDAAFQITDGAGSSQIKLNYSSRTGALKGMVKLRAPQLDMIYESLPMKTDLEFIGKVNSVDLSKRIFDLKGSTLRLDRVITGGSRRDPSSDTNWSLLAELGTTEFHWQQPMLLNGSMQLQMTDTAPIVSLFSEKKRLLKLLKPILTIPDIQGYTEFDLTKTYFEFSKIRVSGDNLDLLAKARLGRFRKRAAVYVLFRGVPFTLTMENDRKKAILIKPFPKYERFQVDW